jgi:hypothetical protein
VVAKILAVNRVSHEGQLSAWPTFFDGTSSFF